MAMQREWMSLDDAQASGVDVSGVLPAIGPRRAGTLYRGGYWREMNQVVAVSVLVDTGRQVAVSWEVSEYSLSLCAGVPEQMRHHCTSWEYDSGNRVHHGPGDLRRVLTF